MTSTLRERLGAPRPTRTLTATLAAASAGGVLVGALSGWPLWLRAVVAVAPWLALLARDTAVIQRTNAALALFWVLVVTQVGHLVEHLVQVVQVDVLGRSGDAAGGVVTVLDTEWVHFAWNTWILAATIPLLLAYRRNRWLRAALVAAVWHQVEHTWLVFEYLRTGGLPGNAGLLASGGAIAGGLPLSRVDLHFLYNVVEVVPLLVAFAIVIRQPRPSSSAGAPVRRRLVASVGTAAAMTGALVGAAIAVAPDDYVGTVLSSYAADFPLSMVAPTFVPDGFHLVDGDGPWTTMDQDRDGIFEVKRAELMYAPERHRGVAPLMISMETRTDLSPLAGGYQPVRLPSGEAAWLSTTPTSDWSALLWNRGELTVGIQSSGISVEDMLRIAASMAVVPED